MKKVIVEAEKRIGKQFAALKNAGRNPPNAEKEMLFVFTK